MDRFRVPQRRTGGFTLIEMLVVIAIIVTLMSILLPVVSYARKRAAVRSTAALIQGIAAGLERFKAEFDKFPPSTIGDLGDSGAAPGELYKALCGADGHGPYKDTVTFVGGSPQTKTVRLEPFVTIPEEYLRKVGADVIIVDAWGKPIVYLNCLAYTQQQKNGNPNYEPDTRCHNPFSFDIYSTGPDREKDSDPPNKTKDQPNDITNW